jgi:hypothetical protein
MTEGSSGSPPTPLIRAALIRKDRIRTLAFFVFAALALGPALVLIVDARACLSVTSGEIGAGPMEDVLGLRFAFTWGAVALVEASLLLLVTVVAPSRRAGRFCSAITTLVFLAASVVYFVAFKKLERRVIQQRASSRIPYFGDSRLPRAS